MPLGHLTNIPLLGARSATQIVVASDASVVWPSEGDGVRVCDGTADEVQLAAAIAALPTAGGKIIVSDGTLTMAAGLTLTTGVTIEGQGIGATTLDVAGSFTVFTMATAYGTLKNFTVDGKSRTHTANIVAITSGSNYLLDLRILAVRAEAVKFSGNGFDNFLRGLILEQCGYADDSEAVLDFSGESNANIITDCHIEENQWHAVRTSGNALANRFVNVKIHGDASGTRYRAFSLESVRNILSACYLPNHDVGVFISAAANTVGNCYIVATDTTGIDQTSRDGIIAHNTIESAVVGIAVNFHRNIIHGNRLDTLSGVGIDVTGGNFSRIDGNEIREGDLEGIKVVGNDNEITDNTIHNIGKGTTNTYNAIHIDGDRNTATGNRVEDDTPDMQYAIHIDTGEANNVVERNILNDNGATGRINDLGTTTRIRDNIGAVASGDVVSITLVIDHAALTDDGGATGRIDFAETIPAGSIIKSVKSDFTEAWNSDNTTTLTMMIGIAGDLDAYNLTADPGENAFNHTTDVFWGESDCQAHRVTAAATPRVTFTEDNNIGDIIGGAGAAGKVDITITYMKA